MRRVLLAVLMTAATTMMMAGPADAGGPTSVLLTSPGTARAAALYYTDPRYAELEALLHGQEAEGSEGTTRYPGAAEDTALNVTWLIHDVSIWRTDQLVLGAAGGAWVATWMTLDDGGDDGAWRPASRPGGPWTTGTGSRGSSPRSACSAGPGATTRETRKHPRERSWRHPSSVPTTPGRRRPRRQRTGGATSGDPLVHPDRLEVGRTRTASRSLRRVRHPPERSCRLRTAPGVHRCRARAGYCAWLTLDMLKSGTRRAGVAVRLK